MKLGGHMSDSSISGTGKRRLKRNHNDYNDEVSLNEVKKREMASDDIEKEDKEDAMVISKASSINANKFDNNVLEQKANGDRGTEQMDIQQQSVNPFLKNKKRQLYQPNYTNQNKRSRQQEWEERQLRNAVTQDNTDEIVVEGSENYEFIFDDDVAVEYTSDVDDVLNQSDEDEEVNDQYEKQLRDRLDKIQSRVLSIQEARKTLPVYTYRDDLLKAIKENQVLIVVGETGSGKTTQLPQYLIEDGYSKGGKLQVAVTQPRRVAATSVAARVADEMDVLLGNEVGYSIRFDDKTSPNKTILKYMTDGMLLREFLIDPELSKYACIMIDEAHERTLATDILLGLLKSLLSRRKDLKILISSATMNATKFSNFFFNCPIFNVPGRRFPVDIHYTLQPEANYMYAAITTIFQIHTTQKLPGDILVFLTGQDEIEKAQEKIESIVNKLGDKIPKMLVTPIYANLPQEKQDMIFQKTPEGYRKIVLATNIAETSLTIDGIKYVIDPGYVKENSFSPSTGMSQLLTVPCSQASVNQRAGRAGRVGPGKCFRIFTKWSYFHELEKLPKPEILRTNLSYTILLLLSLGVTNLLEFQLLDRPSVQNIKKSLEELYILGAINSEGKITKLGLMMCEFPCEPQFGKVLYTASTHEKCKGVLEECLTIVAMLHETTSLFAGKKLEAMKSIIGSDGANSDHILYLKIYDEWKANKHSKRWCHDNHVQFKTLLRVRNIRTQLSRCCGKLGLTEKQNKKDMLNNNDINIEEKVLRAFISGFAMNLVKLGNNGYHTVGGSLGNGGIDVALHPSSVLHQQLKEQGRKPWKYVLYQQLMYTSREFVSNCIPIPNDNLIAQMVPQLYSRLGATK